MSEESPMVFTTNPRLSFALHGNGADFEKAMESVGREKTLAWLQNRVGDAIAPEYLEGAIAAWFDAESNDERVMARAELAEMLLDVDESTSELLWEASMRHGFERDDSEQAFDAVSHLARFAEETGDPATAAELYIDFLNWRREAGRVSDPESIHQAFEEIIRLAQASGEAAVAARFEHAHAEFASLDETGAESASEGDWSPNVGPYTGWD